MTDCVIVIPVYKPTITGDEALSLDRCLNILCNYSIIFVAPESMSTAVYEQACNKHGIQFKDSRFHPSFFKDIQGYNRLLLNKSFYQSFQEYSYMLIYQLDAYVFSDNLESWCEKGYDFIGAPIFSKAGIRVGNGGFSLRKIKPILEFFNANKNVFPAKSVIENIRLKEKPFTRIFALLMMMAGWRNKPLEVADRWKYNEDDFWSNHLSNSRFALRTPPFEVAMKFSFECKPSTLWAMCNNELPFGCHAWRKYEYDSFWKDHIG